MKNVLVMGFALALTGCSMEKDTTVITEEATQYRGCDVTHLKEGRQVGNVRKQAATLIDHDSYFVVEQKDINSITSEPLTTKFGNAMVSNPSLPTMYGKGTGPYSKVFSIYYKQDETALTFDCRKASLISID
ncbi:hypothetical protein M8R21_47365 [Klebsiella sp. T2.Ur]|nr:hypothetical protein [Klebsiella sp. T2.Ur]HCL5637803.1 hypothetical protein [Klebsiella aerogenes]